MIASFTLPLAGCLALTAALPVQAETTALGGATPSAFEAAGPKQLFPPLPSLASLPPSSAEQIEDAAPVPSGRRSGKKGRRASPARKAVEASVRVVVSEETQAYLSEVEQKLDDALRAPARDSRRPAGPVSVAQIR